MRSISIFTITIPASVANTIPAKISLPVAS
nr:MAG TPA: hypothetical protein [Caudoviricetes sp.]